MIGSCNLQGIDAAWLAADASGQIAVFTTGGEGPIPESALPSMESGEDAARGLPAVSDVDLLSSYPRPDDFIAFARRGLFAYDWSDVHRSSAQELGVYELQARPFQPLHLADLPAPLQAMAAATRLSSVVFGASIVVPAEWVGT
jgi:hypothetical protein